MIYGQLKKKKTYILPNVIYCPKTSIVAILTSDKMWAKNIKMLKIGFITPITIGINAILAVLKTFNVITSIQNHFR